MSAPCGRETLPTCSGKPEATNTKSASSGLDRAPVPPKAQVPAALGLTAKTSCGTKTAPSSTNPTAVAAKTTPPVAGVTTVTSARTKRTPFPANSKAAAAKTTPPVAGVTTVTSAGTKLAPSPANSKAAAAKTTPSVAGVTTVTSAVTKLAPSPANSKAAAAKTTPPVAGVTTVTSAGTKLAPSPANSKAAAAKTTPPVAGVTTVTSARNERAPSPANSKAAAAKTTPPVAGVTTVTSARNERTPSPANSKAAAAKTPSPVYPYLFGNPYAAKAPVLTAPPALFGKPHGRAEAMPTASVIEGPAAETPALSVPSSVFGRPHGRAVAMPTALVIKVPAAETPALSVPSSVFGRPHGLAMAMPTASVITAPAPPGTNGSADPTAAATSLANTLGAITVVPLLAPPPPASVTNPAVLTDCLWFEDVIQIQHCGIDVSQNVYEGQVLTSNSCSLNSFLAGEYLITNGIRRPTLSENLDYSIAVCFDKALHDGIREFYKPVVAGTRSVDQLYSDKDANTATGNNFLPVAHNFMEDKPLWSEIQEGIETLFNYWNSNYAFDGSEVPGFPGIHDSQVVIHGVIDGQAFLIFYTRELEHLLYLDSHPRGEKGAAAGIGSLEHHLPQFCRFVASVVQLRGFELGARRLSLLIHRSHRMFQDVVREGVQWRT